MFADVFCIGLIVNSDARANLTPTQVWRPEMAKRLSKFASTMIFATTHDSKAGHQKARSPALTPTQVWRPEKLKVVASAANMWIFYSFL